MIHGFFLKRSLFLCFKPHKNRFRNLYFLAFSVLIIASCTNGETQWSEQFAHASCSLQQLNTKYKTDSIDRIAPIITKKLQYQIELQKIKAPYETRIQNLEQKISEAESNYMVNYRKVTDKQSEQYGHNTTPTYERKIQLLQNNLTLLQESYEVAIKNVKTEIILDRHCISLNKQIKDLETQKFSAQGILNDRYKPRFDSLNEQLFILNREYNDIVSRISPKDRKNFEFIKKSIERNPCAKK